MNDPKVKENAGIFAFEWAEEGIYARADHVRSTKDNMYAELTITSTRPAPQHGHIHHSKVNLLSTTGRTQVANLCEKRIDDLPWSHIIEVICETVIRLSRSGTPALPIIDIEIDEAMEWRLFPVLHVGHPTILFGYGAVTVPKNAFALMLVDTIAWLVEMTDADTSRKMRRSSVSFRLAVMRCWVGKPISSAYPSPSLSSPKKPYART